MLKIIFLNVISTHTSFHYLEDIIENSKLSSAQRLNQQLFE
jgi:hypothetical protein